MQNASSQQDEQAPVFTLSEIFRALCVALLMAFFLRLAVVELYRVPTQSMQPALLPGDYIILSKLAYSLGFSGSLAGWEIPRDWRFFFGKPANGDIIVFKAPDQALKFQGIMPQPGQPILYVKRVIAGPGDPVPGLPRTVPYKGMKIRITTNNTDEWKEFLHIDAAGARIDTGLYQVRENYYYVKGDNAAESSDSRDWGFLPESAVIGKAVLIYWSAEHDTVRWKRMGNFCN
jgi:signal peptidase I